MDTWRALLRPNRPPNINIQMPTSNNSASSTPRTSPVYKFRAECASDAHSVRGVLLPWLLRWKEEREIDEHDDQPEAFGGVTVEFSLRAGGPDIGCLYWLLDTIPDCHVASQTLCLIEDYTGDRSSRRPWNAPATRPSCEVLDDAVAATLRQQELMRLQLDRAQENYRVIQSAKQAGDAWPAIREAAGNPGWVIVLSTKVEGVQAIRSVRAPFGVKNWASKKESVIGARVKTLNA
jgi:hypothetical protein